MKFHTERIKQYTKMFKKNPDFIAHLQIFREMGSVLTQKQIGYK